MDACKTALNLRPPRQALAVAGCLLIAAACLARETPQHRVQAPVKYAARASLGKGATQAALSNGMILLVQENHAAPIATVRCFVRNTGSAYEGRYLGAGISHMLEHLVALGTTERRPEAEIRRLLDSMGGQTNAFTSSDRTGFYVDCPATKVDLAIDLIAESMQFSVIPENEYLREMGVVQRELEMGQTDRNRMLYQSLVSLIYQEHPIRHPTIGYLPVVQSVHRQDVIDFYKSRYVPQNMVFVVVGDVDTDHVLDQVLAAFRGFQRTTERGVVLPLEPQQTSPRSTRLEMEGETTDMSFGWPTVPLQHPDLYPLDVMSFLLANGDSSRLGYRLRMEQPLAISVDCYSHTPGFVKGCFVVNVQCRPDNVATCRRTIFGEIKRLQEEWVGEAELAKVKRQNAADHVFLKQTVQSQANSLASGFLGTGDPMFDDRYVEGINRVTAEQVRDVARRYLLPMRRNTVVIDPPGHASDEPDQVAETIESNILRRRLDNGLIVLLKRHAVTPTISIQAFVRAGVLSDTPEASGRAALACQLFKRGTEKYRGQQIAEYFDSIGGSLEMNSQRSSSFLQCSILKEDLETALDYMHQVLFKPTFPAAEFAKVQTQQIGRIAARRSDPRMAILDFWIEQLPEDAPYRLPVLGTEETVAAQTVEDCRRFHQTYFVPNNMVLAVFGDIDPESTLNRLDEIFGKEPAAPDFSFPQFPKQLGSTTAREATRTTQNENSAMLIVGYPTTSILDVPTRNAIEVLDSILTGGGGAGGRLFDELRGERLVYYIFGRETVGLAPGFFFFMAQTLPETVNEVIQRIKDNLEEIRQKGLDQEAFQLAKEKLIAAHAMRNTTPGSQAFQAAVFELYGLGYDHDDSYDERIRNVRMEDVQDVIERFFREPIVVTSKPGE
ncbi:MAG: M16 family metallopeptidase [Pirellulaceae bacterium]